MTRVISYKDLRETTLWKLLDKGYKNQEDNSVSKVFAANLPNICEKASNRMKAMISLHGQYTLHDEIHLVRVTELLQRLCRKGSLVA